MFFRKILTYLLFLLPWFLSGILVPISKDYYLNLHLPFFAPPAILFGIVWPILYFFIAYSISHSYKNSTWSYRIWLGINYLANQLYTWCFFVLKNNLLALVDVFITLVSSIYLYREVRIIQKNYAWYLIPYIIWNLFALFLSFFILVMN